MTSLVLRCTIYSSTRIVGFNHRSNSFWHFFDSDFTEIVLGNSFSCSFLTFSGRILCLGRFILYFCSGILYFSCFILYFCSGIPTEVQDEATEVQDAATEVQDEATETQDAAAEGQEAATEAVAQDDFSEIAVEEVPEAVTSMIETNYPGATVNGAAKNEAGHYKVEVSLEDGTSGALIVDEEGNAVEQ